MSQKVLSNRLIKKLVLTFLAILLLAGAGYTFSTLYFSNRYVYETSQRLHAQLAQDLIDEKFTTESPVDSTGQINKALFGDIMHDMMAVNRAIEVYLLDSEGYVQYSVVLDHNAPETNKKQISLGPIQEFIAAKGEGYILGDDPKNLEAKQVFSAAPLVREGFDGYVYILLAGENYLQMRENLWGSYALKMGLGGSILTLVFAGILGVLSVWYLTRNLRELVFAARRFQEGDLAYRIADAEKTDLAGVTTTYNEMASTILADMDKIKSLEKMRTELIANISHDLRTPLAIIQGYVETLQMKEADLSTEERKVYLERIGKSSQRLGGLIAQLFEYSKLESRQIEPVKEPFLLSELASDIYGKYKVLADKKNIQLELDKEGDIPLVFGDIGLVERAIHNLMDNALKFTPDGGRVSVALRPTDREVEITIRDSGPGIPKEQQSLIFERYRQVKAEKQEEGVGLGLAIVKKILELHDASIQVFSNPNEGASFSFCLPVYVA